MNNQLQANCLTYDQHQGLSTLQIAHPLFTATISEYGGQLLSFTPKGKRDLIWLSNSAVTDGSKAIRGGVPLCWPWFGAAPSAHKNQPQHGYARTCRWQLDSIAEGDTEVRLVMKSSDLPLLVAEQQLDLTLIYTFSDHATVTMETVNRGANDCELSLAIHSYFNVEDINQTRIPELKGVIFFDKLTETSRELEQPLTVDEPMDRIFDYASSELTIETEKDKIALSHSGHDSIVVWNPWQTGAKAMNDFDDIGYQQMLCVEAALTKGYIIKPGETKSVSQRFGFISAR